MNILGLQLKRESLIQSIGLRVDAGTLERYYSGVPQGNWWGGPWTSPMIWGPHEPSTGAWQRNITADPQPSILSSSTIFAIITGIASDIAKMRVKLSRNEDDIFTEVKINAPWLPVIETPNHYQTQSQFIEQWMVSKLIYGNSYILKHRQDRRGIVTAMYTLHPGCVKVLVAESGEIYYDIGKDDLSRTRDIDQEILDGARIVVPASEVIHDRMVPFWHPLVGVSPLYAAANSATMGNRIQTSATRASANLIRPGGILSTDARISDETAARVKATFEAGYSGENINRIAVLGDGLKFQAFEAMTSAVDAELIASLNWTVADAARAFHYPLFKLDSKSMPPYAAGPEILSQMYYSDCLQPHIKMIEDLLRVGLELPKPYDIEFELDDLLRMDTKALYESIGKGVKDGWLAVNEGRFRANYKSVKGGDIPTQQEQNWPIDTLSERPGFNSVADIVPQKIEPIPPTVSVSRETKSIPTKEEIEAMMQSVELQLRTELEMV